jgi:hypothetical protein
MSLLCTASYIIINLINSLAISMTEDDKESKGGNTQR